MTLPIIEVDIKFLLIKIKLINKILFEKNNMNYVQVIKTQNFKA